MKKPYIICHMMISIDGRIDCAMTSKLPGVNDYYTTLDEISLLVGAGIDGRGGMPPFLKVYTFLTFIPIHQWNYEQFCYHFGQV